MEGGSRSCFEMERPDSPAGFDKESISCVFVALHAGKTNRDEGQAMGSS